MFKPTVILLFFCLLLTSCNKDAGEQLMKMTRTLGGLSVEATPAPTPDPALALKAKYEGALARLALTLNAINDANNALVEAYNQGDAAVSKIALLHRTHYASELVLPDKVVSFVQARAEMGKTKDAKAKLVAASYRPSSLFDALRGICEDLIALPSGRLSAEEKARIEAFEKAFETKRSNLAHYMAILPQDVEAVAEVVAEVIKIYAADPSKVADVLQKNKLGSKSSAAAYVAADILQDEKILAAAAAGKNPRLFLVQVTNLRLKKGVPITTGTTTGK